MVLLKKKQKQTTKNTWKRVPQHGERSRMYVGASTKVPKYFERSQSARMFELTWILIMGGFGKEWKK